MLGRESSIASRSIRNKSSNSSSYILGSEKMNLISGEDGLEEGRLDREGSTASRSSRNKSTNSSLDILGSETINPFSGEDGLEEAQVGQGEQHSQQKQQEQEHQLLFRHRVRTTDPSRTIASHDFGDIWET